MLMISCIIKLIFELILKGGLSLKANETTIQPILEGTKQYIIPMFQRTYSWDLPQWEQLFEDIMEINEETGIDEHFIGSFVSMNITSGPHDVQKYLIIDGQQRLTTILILLSVIRDKAREQKNDRLAEEILEKFLVNKHEEGEEYFKFLPTQVDRKNFKQIIVGNTNSLDENSLITKAYKYFYNVIDEEIDIKYLKSIITSSLSVVSIVLDQDDNPYRVFESLNAKGRPLTQADLIRNFFFMRIPQKEQETVYEDYWKPMQEALGERLTDFIRHYLMRDGTNVRKSDVYYILKNRVGDSDAINHLRELKMFSDYYNKLLNPTLERNKKVALYIERINELELGVVYPFLLSIYDEYQQERYSADHFVEVLKMLENFLIRRFVCDIASKHLTKIFLPLYSKIKVYNPAQAIDEAKAYLQVRGYPKDNEFKHELLSSKLYGQGDRRKKTKFILHSIERSYNHKEIVSINKASIEHIMPQTLTDSWIGDLGEDHEVIHDIYLHRLGNLTLSGYNAELSNEPFDVKKKYYIKSNFELNKKMSVYNKWNKENIEKRSEELANQCLKVWPYFGKEVNEIKKVTGTAPRVLYVLGQKFSVSTWRAVLENTLKTILELEPDKFETLVEKYPRFISINKDNLRSPYSLPNGMYFEVNLSANDIYRFCLKFIEEIELSKEDWQIEITVKE